MEEGRRILVCLLVSCPGRSDKLLSSKWPEQYILINPSTRTEIWPRHLLKEHALLTKSEGGRVEVEKKVSCNNKGSLPKALPLFPPAASPTKSYTTKLSLSSDCHFL